VSPTSACEGRLLVSVHGLESTTGDMAVHHKGCQRAGLHTPFPRYPLPEIDQQSAFYELFPAVPGPLNRLPSFYVQDLVRRMLRKYQIDHSFEDSAYQTEMVYGNGGDREVEQLDSYWCLSK
jgi:hypothetical protein